MTIGCDLGNRIVGIMGGDAIMAEFEKYAKPMPQMIPLLELQDIRREIAEEKERICIDIDDDVARHVNLGLSSGLGMALEIIDKHISTYEGTL